MPLIGIEKREAPHGSAYRMQLVFCLYITQYFIYFTLNSSITGSKTIFCMTIFGKLHLQVNCRSLAIM